MQVAEIIGTTIGYIGIALLSALLTACCWIYLQEHLLSKIKKKKNDNRKMDGK